MDEVSTNNKYALHSEMTEDQAMDFALELAAKGWGWVSPNPAVGCVILDLNNRLIGFGYHEKFGGPHAEVNALRGLTPEQLQGARVFVTLEPCSHYGKTPPCAEALAKLPISEVIYGLQDPNPQVHGKGLAILQQAGIKVTFYDKKREAFENVCEHFLKNMRHQKPFVTLKAAVSLDGKLALKNGQSQWITGKESRQEGHRLRAHHDAILVGVNTFLTDNPSLNIRDPLFPGKTNQVIVLDPSGRGIKNIKSSKLYATHKPENIIWVLNAELKVSFSSTSKNVKSLDESTLFPLQEFKELGIKLIFIDKFTSISNLSNTLNLSELLQELWNLNIRSILVEGGGATISSFLNQKAADRLSLFMAPMVIGDVSGVGWSSSITPIEELSQSMKLGTFTTASMGKDVLFSTRILL